MISVEVLSKIFKKRVISIEPEKNILNIYFENGKDIINIYELAFLIKSWALYEGFILNSENGYCDITRRGHQKTHLFDFYAKTEEDAIFEAANWLHTNKNIFI